MVPEFNIYYSSWALPVNVYYPLLHGVLACGKTTFSLGKVNFLLVFPQGMDKERHKVYASLGSDLPFADRD
jgi:hypothetical protein